jgi:hypothetical protein
VFAVCKLLTVVVSLLLYFPARVVVGGGIGGEFLILSTRMLPVTASRFLGALRLFFCNYETVIRGIFVFCHGSWVFWFSYAYEVVLRFFSEMVAIFLGAVVG